VFASRKLNGKSESLNLSKFMNSDHYPTKSILQLYDRSFSFEQKPKSVVGWKPQGMVGDKDGSGMCCPIFEVGILNRLGMTGSAKNDLENKKFLKLDVLEKTL
jgi:hypothetical protein